MWCVLLLGEKFLVWSFKVLGISSGILVGPFYRIVIVVLFLRRLLLPSSPQHVAVLNSISLLSQHPSFIILETSRKEDLP